MRSSKKFITKNSLNQISVLNAIDYVKMDNNSSSLKQQTYFISSDKKTEDIRRSDHAKPCDHSRYKGSQD